MTNEILQNQELIDQLRDNIQMIYTVAGTIITGLIGGLGIVWAKWLKTLDALEAKNIAIKDEYKENMNLFFELKIVLEGLTSGVKTDLPDKIMDLKSHLSEKIRDLKLKSNDGN